MIKLLFLAALLLFSLQTNSVNAHVLVTDETKQRGAILHIIPDDDPIAGQLSTIYFDIQTTQQAISDASVTIRSQKGQAETVNVEIDGSLVIAEYTFPYQGLYSLEFMINSGDDISYTFTYSQRVSRGVSESALDRPTHAWAEALFIASSALFVFLVILAINRRRTIAVHSKF